MPDHNAVPQPECADSTVWVVTVASACAAAFAPAHPTGIVIIDVIERAALGAIVAWFAARSRPWTRILLAGVATILAGSIWGVMVGGLTLVAAVLTSVRPPRRTQVVSAAIGAVSVQVLLRTDPFGGFGLSALGTAVAVTVVVVSGFGGCDRRVRRRLRIAAWSTAGVLVVATAGFVFTAWRAAPDLDQGLTYAQTGVDYADDGNQLGAAVYWVGADGALSKAHDSLSSPLTKLAYVVPIVSQHAQLITKASAVGAELTAAASRAAVAAPYASIRGSDGNFDLDAISGMRRPIVDTVDATRHALKDLDAVRSPWLIGSVGHRVDRYREELTKTIPRASDALTALEVAPKLLGADGPRHYLALFANPAESRGMGGFIGAWAQIDVDNGQVRLGPHGHIGDLNDATDWRTRGLSGESEYQRRYAQLQPARFLQNISASPDFPTVARVAEQLYPQAGGTSLDGVFYIDPIALGALLELTGPVRAKGIPMALTSKNAADYLMHDQYLRFSMQRGERLDLLSNAAEATFEALTHGKLPPVGKITDTLAPMVHQRSLLFWVDDHEAADYLDSVGLSGAFPAPAGQDLLSVRISNGSANKADYYLDQTTQYRARYDPLTGATTATARIVLVNHAPSSGEPPYILGNQDSRRGREDGRPYGSDTVQLSVYTALRPEEMRVDEAPVGIQIQRELGSWVSTQTVTVPAGGRVTVDLSFAGELAPNANYHLQVIPQPSARPRHTTVTVEPVDPRGAPVDPLATTRSFDDGNIAHFSAPATVRGGSRRAGS